MNRQHIEHGQRIIHNFSKPLSQRLESRKYTDPYIVTPQHAGKDRKYPFYLDSDFMPSLRWEYAHEIIKLKHTGWYSDNAGIGDTIKGIVMRLSHGRGFLAGWTMGKGMISKVEAYIYDSDRDAAYAADSLAQYAAEESRDQDAQFLAEQDIECARETISDCREHVHNLVTELRSLRNYQCYPETICKIIRADIIQSMREVREQCRIIQLRKNNYWTSINGF